MVTVLVVAEIIFISLIIIAFYIKRELRKEIKK